MVKFLLSMLKWVKWLIQYAVVYPLGFMALLVVLVFWKGAATPGQVLVNTIESVQREGFVIHDCTGPASRGELNGGKINPSAPPVLKEDCSLIRTDATGYAADIDKRYIGRFVALWLLMVMVFTGGAVLFDPSAKLSEEDENEAKEK